MKSSRIRDRTPVFLLWQVDLQLLDHQGSPDSVSWPGNIISSQDGCLQPNRLICKTRVFEVVSSFREKSGLLVSKKSVHCVCLVSCRASFLLGRGPPTLLTSLAVDKDCRPRRLTWKGYCRGFCGTKRWPIDISPLSVWGCCLRAKRRRSGNSFKVTRDPSVKPYVIGKIWEVFSYCFLSTYLSKSSFLNSQLFLSN